MNEITIPMDRFENLIEAEIKLKQIEVMRRSTQRYDLAGALLAILGPVQQEEVKDDARPD